MHLSVYVIYFTYFTSTFLTFSSCLLHSFTHIRSNRNNYYTQRSYLVLQDSKYAYAKEYYDFYRKYQGPIIQSNKNINYDKFAEKNKEKYRLFEKNMKSINEANEYLKNSNISFTLDVNKYADIIDFDNSSTNELMNNPIIDKRFRPNAYLKIFQRPFPYIETIITQNKKMTYNWNTTGLLSAVKNQGRCGSCWAFSSTSALETFMRINGYYITRLSEQELVDCSKDNFGCEGGFMHLAFDYIRKSNGLVSHDKYPYYAKDQECSIDKHIKAAGSQLSEYQFTIPKSMLDMKLNVIQTPIAIALDADNIFFRFYKSGVIDVPANYSSTMNHAVLLVGFDYDEDGMYWIIQNSWGKDWGENGFCRIRARPGKGVLECQQYGVFPTKINDYQNNFSNYEI